MMTQSLIGRAFPVFQQDNVGLLLLIQKIVEIRQVPRSSVTVDPTWATPDTFSWCYSVVAHLIQTLDMDEGFVHVLAHVSHLGPVLPICIANWAVPSLQSLGVLQKA